MVLQAWLFFDSPTHHFQVLSCFGLFSLPFALHCSRLYDDGHFFMRTNFLKAAVVEESLESRHVRFFWNSLQCSVITFIVSVFTAPRRAPRTGRMLLQIPLDPPLSVLVPVCFPENKRRVFAFPKAPALVWVFALLLFCDIIISSIVHKVKRSFAFFYEYNHQKIRPIFIHLHLCKRCPIWYNSHVGALRPFFKEDP